MLTRLCWFSNLPALIAGAVLLGFALLFALGLGLVGLFL